MNMTSTLVATLATLSISLGAIAQTTAKSLNIAGVNESLINKPISEPAEPPISQADTSLPTDNALLEQSLLDRGLIKQENGLYLDSSSKDPSYLAIDANGMKALAIQIDKDRQRYQKIALKDGVSLPEQRLDQALLKSSADLATLAVNLPANAISCLSTEPERSAASVSASGGTSASAAAVSAASVDQSEPEATTYNVAQSYVESASNSASAIGATPATAMNTDHQSCFSYAIASLACADPNKLAAIAYAPSFSVRRDCVAP